MNPRLSVVVCARDDRERLARTLDSVTGQDRLAEVEIVLVDGASTDGTLDLAREVLAGVPLHVLDSRPDGGVYDAMNRGLRLATGDYVYFLNCGDAFRTSTTLAQLVDELPPENDRALLIGRVRHLAGGAAPPFVTATVPFRIPRFLAGRQDYNHQAMVFHRGAATAAGGFRLQYGVVSDYDLILRLCFVTAPKEIPLVIADYEGGGLSAQAPAQIPRLQARVRHDVFRLHGLPAWVNGAYGRAQSRRRGGLRTA